MTDRPKIFKIPLNEYEQALILEELSNSMDVYSDGEVSKVCPWYVDKHDQVVALVKKLKYVFIDQAF